MIAILLAPVYLLANYYLLRRVMGWVKAWFPFFRTVRHWALPVAVQAQYSNGESEYSITIHRFTTALKASQSFLEKDDGEFDVRNINGVDYYILSNVDNRNVTWTVDNLQVVISGSLSDDEINSMIDSINEG